MNNKYIPYWINPYPTIIFGSIAQAILTTLSIINKLPIYFIIGVIIWKLTILLITIKYIKKDFTSKTILFNLIIFLLYLYVLAYNNKNIFDIYTIVISDKTYFNNLIKNRLNFI